MGPYQRHRIFYWILWSNCVVAPLEATASERRGVMLLAAHAGGAAGVDSHSVVDRNRLVRLRAEQTARRFVTGLGVVEGSAAGDAEEIVYRNADGPLVYPLNANEWVADDLTTICGSSYLTRIVVQVTGGGEGAGPGFGVEVDLYSGCPSQNGVPISGTHFAVNLPDDGLFTVEHDLSGTPVPIGREVWLAIRSSSNQAGWVFGGEPEIGHSDEVVDAPPFSCSASFGGCPPDGPACANGTATLYAVDCVPEFVAYRADAISPYFVGMELSDLFADDIAPTTHFADQLCDIVSYEPQFAGLNGPYAIATEIWSQDHTQFRPLAPVPGTQCGNGVPCLFNPPVQIPTTTFFVAYDLVFGDNAGPVLVGDYPSVGSSADIFCIGAPEEPWSCIWFFGGCGPGTDNPCATFKNEISCAGMEPTGACCLLDSQSDFHCVDDIRISACDGRFALGFTCEEQPFDPPCGTAACCLDDESCQNFSRNDCQTQGGEWLVGEFCHSGLCFGACDCPSGPECCGWPGPCLCDDPVCCQTVCEIDAFCCAVKWDESCCDLANVFCEIAPQQDECSSATTLMCNDSILISNLFAADDPSDPGFSCHNGGQFQHGVGSVWAKFVAITSTARLRTCDSVPPADDSLLAIYAGPCGNLSEIGCNDDTPGCAATNLNSEACVSGLAVGQTYYVQLASWTESDRGRYELSLECPAVEPCASGAPINDHCENATPISFGTFSFTNEEATNDPGGHPSCIDFGSIGRDIWYDFEASTSGPVRISLCDETDFDTVVVVYQGCDCEVSFQDEVGCDDEGCWPDFGPSKLAFEAEAGNCYKIRVAGFGGTAGHGTMAVTGISCPSGAVEFLNPPSGVVDARLPNPLNQPLPMLGVRTFTMSAPIGADDGCFSMCETGGLSMPNSIESVTDNGMGTYMVTLDRPMTPYAITRIAYQPDSGPATIGTFISHPANVNGDSVAGPTDILAIIDCLNGVNLSTNCPWGIFSTDIDHSGVFNPADVLRVIDLLNGIVICPWEGCPEPGPNPLPTGTCVP